MPIKITVGSPESPPETPKKPIAKVELQIRKTLDGDLLITDHADMDIIIMKKKKKIVAFPKDIMSEVVYGAQDRLFKFLAKKGLIQIHSVQGGSIYGSIEAEFLAAEEYDPVTLSIINIEKWIDSERPYFEFVEEYEEMDNDRFVDPDEEMSTELGEVPHETTKGNIRPGYNFGPYWQSMMLERKQRGE
tara:strand:+ start:1057 stop:1623 length:567 start_codon:yes stop_codon:yes gene_type:complete